MNVLCRRPLVVSRQRLVEQLSQHARTNQTGLAWTGRRPSQHELDAVQSHRVSDSGEQPRQRLVGSKVAAAVTAAGITAAGLLLPLSAHAQDVAVNTEQVQLEQQVRSTANSILALSCCSSAETVNALVPDCAVGSSYTRNMLHILW